MPDTSAVYRPHKPHDSPYYKCVEDHFEQFDEIYDDRFVKQYGFFRPYVRQVIYRYLDCGILHNGFARVRRGDCDREYFLNSFGEGKLFKCSGGGGKTWAAP